MTRCRGPIFGHVDERPPRLVAIRYSLSRYFEATVYSLPYWRPLDRAYIPGPFSKIGLVGKCIPARTGILIRRFHFTMSETTTITAKRKLRPARKQVKPGDIDKSEGPQPGKEYSESGCCNYELLSRIMAQQSELTSTQTFGTTSGREETKRTHLLGLPCHHSSVRKLI